MELTSFRVQYKNCHIRLGWPRWDHFWVLLWAQHQKSGYNWKLRSEPEKWRSKRISGEVILSTEGKASSPAGLTLVNNIWGGMEQAVQDGRLWTKWSCWSYHILTSLNFILDLTGRKIFSVDICWWMLPNRSSRNKNPVGGKIRPSSSFWWLFLNKQFRQKSRITLCMSFSLAIFFARVLFSSGVGKCFICSAR